MNKEERLDTLDEYLERKRTIEQAKSELNELALKRRQEEYYKKKRQEKIKKEMELDKSISVDEAVEKIEIVEEARKLIKKDKSLCFFEALHIIVKERKERKLKNKK